MFKIRPYVAFFDDSGSPDPSDVTEFFALGMVVIPFELIQTISNSWWDIIRHHYNIKDGASPPILNIEAKSAELYSLYDKLRKNSKLKQEELILVQHYQLSHDIVGNIIRDIWNYLSELHQDITFLGAIVNKHEYWQRYKTDYYDQYKFLVEHKFPKGDIKKIRMQLQKKLLSTAYEYLLQRLQYLMNEIEGNCLVIGDETCNSSCFYSSQSFLQAGYGNFTIAPNIINNVVFGSSLHNPGLQIADWVAFCIRCWAINKNLHITEKFQFIKHKFRQKDGNPFGRGIVLIPNKSYFP